MVPERHDDRRLGDILLEPCDQLFIRLIRLLNQRQIPFCRDRVCILIRKAGQRQLLCEPVVCCRVRHIAGVILHGDLEYKFLLTALVLELLNNLVERRLIADKLPDRLRSSEIIDVLELVKAEQRIHPLPVPAASKIGVKALCRIPERAKIRGQCRYFRGNVLLVHNTSLWKECHRVA